VEHVAIGAPGVHEIALPAVATGRRVLVLHDPARGPAEYFLLENRWRGESYDAGAAPHGVGLPADGLAVWHVLEDPAVFDLLNPTNGGRGDWGRKGLRLLRADGGVARDDARALFGGPGTVIDDSDAPVALRWLDGTASGFRVEILGPPGPTVDLRVTRR
jgi:hypothetical protein